MARKVICQYCRQQFDREVEPFEKKSNGYYHKACFDAMQEERSKRAGILDYLESLTPGQVNYALVQKQLRDFTANGKYSESGLYGTLIYMIEVKKLKMNPKTGLAFLPFIYNEAREHYDKQAYLAEQIKAVDYPEKEVVTKSQQVNKDKLLIDIESLLGKEGKDND